MNGRIHLKTAAALSNDWGPLPPHQRDCCYDRQADPSACNGDSHLMSFRVEWFRQRLLFHATGTGSTLPSESLRIEWLVGWSRRNSNFPLSH